MVVGLGVQLVEQPPPAVAHETYPVHTELPHLKYAMTTGQWHVVYACVVGFGFGFIFNLRHALSDCFFVY